MKFSVSLALVAGLASVVEGFAFPNPFAKAWTVNPPLEKRQTAKNKYKKIIYTDPAFINQMVSVHNAYRAHHGAGGLIWNPTLAEKAYNTSTDCIFRHSLVRPYGENVAAGSYQFNNPSYWIYLWWNEISQYDYNNPGFSSATGHFTQVVWKGSTQLGCAWVQGCSGSNQPVYAQMVWCEYFPPGNVLPASNFAAQVPRELASPAAPAPPAMSTV